MGSNMAENHPIAFRFVMQAKERGATVIHADPRFTRTSALADIYAPVRAGSDVAFLGGLIRYVLHSERWNADPFFREFVVRYTNAPLIVRSDFHTAAEGDGLFSGWQPETRSYRSDSWQYESMTVPSSSIDETLQHPRCVLQLLKRQYAEYTPAMVERVTGCPQETFLRVAEAVLANAGRERTGVWCYAVGWTHHTTGVQMIRAAAILQGLLGNIGRPGAGVLALRGHSSIQGSTDIPSLYNLLPGYLPQPSALKPHRTLADYIAAERTPTGWWHHFPKYAVSLLRAWYGDAATPDNDRGFGWVPKIVGDHSQQPMMLAIRDGTIRGLFVMGQNPVVGGHNTNLIRRALTNLEWMVVRETCESETASSWYKSPEVLAGQIRPQDVATEIFLLPASLPGEKEGTFTNTQRLVQWHDKVVEPPGDCRSDLWFMYHLGRRLKALYADSADPKDAPIQNLTWDYPTEGALEEPSAEAILKEINGHTWPERRQVASFAELKDDGSTACGCWIYSGVYPREGHNQARARVPDGPNGPGTHLGWGFAWPGNRRLLYNRASADPQGRPWSEAKRYVWWDDERRLWIGFDEIDFIKDRPPDYRPDAEQQPTGMDALPGDAPFIMMADGRINLFAPAGLADGPLPTHYEPVESPVRNPLHAQQDNPTAKKWPRPDNPYHDVGDPRYPYVITTYRLTEHHAGGIPTRCVPTLAELQPEGFCEIAPELAAELGIANRDWVVIETARGAIETRALVTERIAPLEVAGRRVHVVGLPWHFGWEGYATGAVANTLSAIVGDPNTTIHEGKAFTCALRKGRLPHPDRAAADGGTT